MAHKDWCGRRVDNSGRLTDLKGEAKLFTS
jgi:hypothetical protein